MGWYLKGLRQYVDFRGRARRREFWMFTLVSFILFVAFFGVDFAVFGHGDPRYLLGELPANASLAAQLEPFSSGYGLLVFLPGLAVTVRRLHDTDRSGWWSLLTLVPTVGLAVTPGLDPARVEQSGSLSLLVLGVSIVWIGTLIVSIVFLAQEGTRSANRFGPSPKAVPQPV